MSSARFAHRVVVVALLSIAACRSSAETKPSGAPASGEAGDRPPDAPAVAAVPAVPTVPTVATVATVPGADPVAVTPKPAEDAVALAQARARAYAKARELAARDELDAAMDAFKEAVEADPDNPRLRCEAGYTAYRAGDLGEAMKSIAEARARFPKPEGPEGPDRIGEELRAPLAMCLYNAGLAEQACGLDEEAQADFAASLALRPNETVARAQRGLAKLPRRAPVEIEVARRRCAAIQEVCREAPRTCEPLAGSPSKPGRDVAVHVLRPKGKTPSDFGAVIFEVVASDMPGSFVAWTLVVWRGAEVRSERVLAAYNPGEDGMETSASIARFAYVDVSEDGAPELVVQVASDKQDDDMGSGSYWSITRRDLIVCGGIPALGGDTLACATVGLALINAGREPGPDDAPLNGRETRRGYSVVPRFAKGVLELVPERGRGLESAARGGSYPLRSLLEDPGYRWPESQIPVDPWY